MKIDKDRWFWTREPKAFSISEDKIDIITNPHTDLWQRTYYHFRNDNAPVLQIKTSEKFFSFVVKTEFESKNRFDQCGVVMYLDSENWLKGSIEYENEEFQHLGSVVTNNGFSDWATTEIDAGIKSMWYRFSRREDDYCIECSEDGSKYKQMRICHMNKATDEIQFGDNDTLSAVVAALIQADLLILLSDIDGLFTDDPNSNPNAEFIDYVGNLDEHFHDMAKRTSGSRVGTGGMSTKLTAAEIATAAGTDMVIANGKDFHIIHDIVEGRNTGTLFASNRKESFFLIDYIEKLL